MYIHIYTHIYINIYISRNAYGARPPSRTHTCALEVLFAPFSQSPKGIPSYEREREKQARNKG